MYDSFIDIIKFRNIWDIILSFLQYEDIHNLVKAESHIVCNKRVTRCMKCDNSLYQYRRKQYNGITVLDTNMLPLIVRSGDYYLSPYLHILTELHTLQNRDNIAVIDNALIPTKLNLIFSVLILNPSSTSFNYSQFYDNNNPYDLLIDYSKLNPNSSFEYIFHNVRSVRLININDVDVSINNNKISIGKHHDINFTDTVQSIVIDNCRINSVSVETKKKYTVEIINCHINIIYNNHFTNKDVEYLNVSFCTISDYILIPYYQEIDNSTIQNYKDLVKTICLNSTVPSSNTILFSTTNTDICTDHIPSYRTEKISTRYFVQYCRYKYYKITKQIIEPFSMDMILHVGHDNEQNRIIPSQFLPNIYEIHDELVFEKLIRCGFMVYIF
jgi:hypothetical protein